MKIIVEGYEYEESAVAKILHGLEPKLKANGVIMDYVGYFYSKEIDDCVFFLPKVILDDMNQLFGRKGLTPDKFIDLQKALDSETLVHADYDFLSNLSVWIYRVIKEFHSHNQDSDILLHTSFSRQDDSDNVVDKTLLDVLLSLVAFNNENQDFFMFITKNIHSGYNKINWTRTVAHKKPIMQNNTAIYTNLINRRKQVNFDEELLVIFFSILQYINDTYGFSTTVNVNYTLIEGEEFESLLNGSGLIRLQRIKYRYYSDKTLELWRLCYSFFEMAQSMQSSKNDNDYLLVRNFYIVFEAMIDELLSDKDLPREMKEQYDGKVVDHIFRYQSLVRPDDIYYLGDSKYYKIGGALGDQSIYKQYTYARNVIQYNLDLFLSGNDCIPYRDGLTEGYNITPNFFISAEIDKENPTYSDKKLRKRPFNEKRDISMQFRNRLFDRDTLLLSHYDINFLFVIALYARANESEKLVFREEIKKRFRREIIDIINCRYEFNILEPREQFSLQRAVDINFKRLYGKTFSPDGKHLLLGLDKGNDYQAENSRLRKEIEPYFYIHPYQLGENAEEKLGHAIAVRKQYSYKLTDNFYDRMVAEPTHAGYENIKRVFNDSETWRNSILADNDLTKQELPKIKSLEEETVLVGYFKDYNHLEQIKRNKLYYTRMGSRQGSLHIDLPLDKNKYLFLHNKRDYLMFKLKEEGPRVFTGEQLMNMGFNVGKKNEVYLGFAIANPEPIAFTNIDIQKAILRGVGNRTADSYFTTLKELFGIN